MKKSSIESKNYDIIEFCVRNVETVRIPSFIKKIGPYSFNRCINLYNIEINDDSELYTIEKSAFANSYIEFLNFPRNLTELKEGWCLSTFNLNEAIISPNNKNFCIYNDNLILGKSSVDIECFDVVVLCFRDVEKVKIPSQIKKIANYAFQKCNYLESVEIPQNS